MSVGFEEPVCREHDNAAVDAQHVDGCAVELGEHVAGDDLVDGAQARPAAPEIEHPVHRAKQRIKLVRSEEHCHTIALLDVSNQLDDALLEVRVETDERLVEQEKLRPADERLREEQPLQLSAGELGERARRERLGLDHGDDAIDFICAAPVEHGKAPTFAVQRAGDEIPAA